jgi:predicted DNA binding protein
MAVGSERPGECVLRGIGGGFMRRVARADPVKQLRITAAVDPERAPPFYGLLADAGSIAETHLLEWNTTAEDLETVLFAIDGDAEPFATAAPEGAGVESVRLSAGEGRWTYALVEMRPTATAMFDAIRTARARPGLVVRKPIVYRDGEMLFRVVGDAERLQDALEHAPTGMDVRVDEIDTLRDGPGDPPAGLSERQREAVAVALDLGYYDRPREATHADVAAALGCAPSTATEHLQKAESKLVRAGMATSPGRRPR